MNILVLTSIFYIPGKSKEYNTKIVNYFVKDWVSQGHNVTVIYNKTVYPKIYYMFPDKVYDFIEGNLGLVIDNKDAIDNDVNFYHGAKVITLPLLKYFPHSSFSSDTIKNQADKIYNVLSKDHFAPDLILGHWPTPQVDLIPLLKKVYNCKGAIVFHSPLKNDSSLNLSEFDGVGFRNKPLLDQALNIYKSLNNPFVCYSGIPEELFESLDLKPKKFNSKIEKYIFVGGLIKRKFPLQTLEALIALQKGFSFEIVGDGSEKSKIEKLIQSQGLKNDVTLHGRISRKDIISMLSNAECFTMISKDEAFGLVYLEAMACGCLVIAARNEGMDGIIHHGINGFLCEAGNVSELISIYKYIDNLSNSEKSKISSEAINTASNFTDAKVAKNYLKNFD